MKKLILLLLVVNYCFSQSKTGKSQLCQGPYFTEAEGIAFHDKLAKKYNDQTSWEKRSDLIKKGIIAGAEFQNKFIDIPVNATIHSKKILDGYSVENVFFESMEGFYVTGNLYRPLNFEGKSAGILCPHGHGVDMRYQEYTQQRCATLARMGAVVFAYDMVGYADSKQCDHQLPKVLKLQLRNSTRALDFIYNLPEVDKNRIGITGESGGGTQTFLLSAIDSRIKVAVPVVMVSEYFFGGCQCESGMPIHKRNTHQTSNTEITALFAPKPLLLISDGADWTKNNPTQELPFIKRIYGFYGAEKNVENVHLADEQHDYGVSKRMAAYPFLAKHLGLEISRVMKEGIVDESRNSNLPIKDLEVYNENYKIPANALIGNKAVNNLLK
jgi:uncharacterized protein